MASRHEGKTAKLYNAGLTLEEAVARGADAAVFQALEEEFDGGSIPAHLLIGFKYTPPYSCDYHSGREQGALLRAIAAASRSGTLRPSGSR